jgi:hypothetical protein
MDRTEKLDLLQRALGLKHKLKVHDSMPRPETHDQIAIVDVARWELEDELHAIEQILREAREKNVEEKRQLILKKGVKKKSKK